MPRAQRMRCPMCADVTRSPNRRLRHADVGIPAVALHGSAVCVFGDRLTAMPLISSSACRRRTAHEPQKVAF
jgi:hypothetical protein